MWDQFYTHFKKIHTRYVYLCTFLGGGREKKILVGSNTRRARNRMRSQENNEANVRSRLEFSEVLMLEVVNCQ